MKAIFLFLAALVGLQAQPSWAVDCKAVLYNPRVQVKAPSLQLLKEYKECGANPATLMHQLSEKNPAQAILFATLQPKRSDEVYNGMPGFLEIEHYLPKTKQAGGDISLLPLSRLNTVLLRRAGAQTIRKLPGCDDVTLIYKIRDEVEAIAGRDGPGIDHDYLDIRHRVHNEFGPIVKTDTEDYLEEVKKKKPDFKLLHDKLQETIDDLELALYRDSKPELPGIDQLPFKEKIVTAMKHSLDPKAVYALNEAIDSAVREANSRLDKGEVFTPEIQSQVIDGLVPEGLLEAKVAAALKKELGNARKPAAQIAVLKKALATAQKAFDKQFDQSIQEIKPIYPEIETFKVRYFEKSFAGVLSRIVDPKPTAAPAAPGPVTTEGN